MSNSTSAPGGWVVLGLLTERSPQSGYELASLAARSIAHFWPLTKAQIYAELPKLESSGYVTGEAVSDGKFPAKRLYRVTPEGVAAFSAWLETLSTSEAKLRHPLMLKVWFGSLMDRRKLVAEIDAVLESLVARRAYFDDLHARLAARRKDDGDGQFPMHRLVVRHALLRLHAEQEWLEEVKQEILRELGEM